jgi:predicted nucleic acid-binding protein
VILADTTVWIEHFRRRRGPHLAALLDAGRVLVHPFVIGELALGQLGPRHVILQALHRLPHAGVATHHETLHMIEERRLYGLGIGYVDAHLLAAVLIQDDASLWTHDARLHRAAQTLGVAYHPLA